MKSLYSSFLICLLLLMGYSSHLSANGDNDNIPPVAICTDQLNVSLTSNGTAIVLAQSFDEGSYDNYCLAAIKVKKTYDPYDDFGPWVVFDCDDIGQLVSVELKAIDCAGNTNSCWVDVWVEDKIDPGIWCPYDKTVACDELYNWGTVGEATAYDACGIASITHEEIDNTGSCGTGYITRLWKATDLYGNMSTCTQTIHVIDNTPVVVYFPQDYVTYDCETEDDLHPDNLPAPFDRPQVLYEDCEIIATSYEDWVFTAAPSSCIKIIRKWKVIDWCTYQYGGSDGYWEGTQILKIQDTIPPTATCPEDFTVSTGYGDCVADIDLPLPTDIEDCLANVDISIHGDLGAGTTHEDIPIGEYEVGYLLEDGCNNKSTCHITVSVVDGQPPGAVCLNGVSLSLMSNGMVELWASDIEQGSSFDACTDYSHLSFRLGLEPQPGQTTPPTDDFLVFDCDDVGVNVIALWVGDAAGNWDYCLTYAVVQDNQGICPGVGGSDTTFTISGLIADEQGDLISGVDVYMDSTSYWAPSDSAGEYVFGAMPMEEDYVIHPQHNSSLMAGLSLSDVITLAKHLMGVDTLDTPYQYIAADVDQDGNLDNDDMMLMHLTLLGLESAFPNGLSWRFVPSDFIFPDVYPLSVNFPETITIDDLDENIEDADFIGIKLGDLDGSATETDTSDVQSIEDRTLLASGIMSIPDVRLHAGEERQLPVYLNDVKIEGLQARMMQEGLEVLEIQVARTSDQLYFNKLEGEVVVSWIPNTQINREQQPSFYLKVKSATNQQLSDALELAPSSTIFSRIGSSYQEAGLSLAFLPASEAFLLHAVYPNPFEEATEFSFEQEAPGKVSLMIWNANGQLVYQQEKYYEQGSHRWEVLASDLGSKGAFIYQLSKGEEQVSGRLLMMGE